MYMGGSYCSHCEAVTHAYPEPEWVEESVIEWLEESYPTVYQSMRSGWRYPDGELLPLPFQPRCYRCGTMIKRNHLWCDSCDEKRMIKIEQDLINLRKEFDNAGS